jgi:glycosyltransferase involved in cell wall biosynthesis
MKRRSALRVVHLITGLNLGGAERMVALLVRSMDRLRFDSSVISLLPGGVVRERIEESGTEVHSLGMAGPTAVPRGLQQLHRILSDRRPHILQTWLYRADLLGLAAAAAMRLPRVLWNIRCAEVTGVLSNSLQRILAPLSRYPTGVIVNSIRGKAFHESIGFAPRAWHLIPNGFDTSTFVPRPESRAQLRQSLSIPRSAQVVGIVARYHPLKNHALFLRAAGLLAAETAQVYFVLAGPGVTDSNAELVQQIPEALRTRVRLLGPRSDIPELVSTFDIATLTSSHEAFPNVVGESMSCGVPCVVTDAGDAAMIVGDTGWCVDASPRALASAWKHALSSPDELRRRGERARCRIVDEFSLERIVTQYEALYAQVAAG